MAEMNGIPLTDPNLSVEGGGEPPVSPEQGLPPEQGGGGDEQMVRRKIEGFIRGKYSVEEVVEMAKQDDAQVIGALTETFIQKGMSDEEALGLAQTIYEVIISMAMQATNKTLEELKGGQAPVDNSLQGEQLSPTEEPILGDVQPNPQGVN